MTFSISKSKNIKPAISHNDQGWGESPHFTASPAWTATYDCILHSNTTVFSEDA